MPRIVVKMLNPVCRSYPHAIYILAVNSHSYAEYIAEFGIYVSTGYNAFERGDGINHDDSISNVCGVTICGGSTTIIRC
jgi:hypothetical protein